MESVLPVAELCGVNASELAREMEGYAMNNKSSVCKDSNNCIACAFVDVHELVSPGLTFKSLRSAMRFFITSL